MSRPKIYTESLGDLICSHIAQGKSLAKLTGELKTLPSPRTVYTWLREYPEFLQNYNTAKFDQADCLAEEILDIADNGTNDWIANCGDDGAIKAYKVNGESIQRSRLRVDARKWIASKLKPKKYGERMYSELSGRVVSNDYSELSGDELDRLILEKQQQLELSRRD